ncbi:MAG: 4-alpha-glucanotransferase, partial [Frankia sp.]|nr:4-alpha-glucanotransferase [Frankia sp.]
MRRLAAANGVATSYDDWQGQRVEVPAATVRRVLAALDVDPDASVATAPRAGRERSAGRRTARRERGPRLAAPAGFDRGWGWMVQLYALRSERSWGIGDFGDLAQLVRWSAADGADALMVNPVHAVTPVHPIEASPYFPSSRRFVNAIYLCIDDVPECAGARRPRAAALSVASELIDRDAAWRAKVRALERGWRAPATPDRAAAFRAFRAERGDALEEFATFCALAEVHGRRWPQWPRRLHDPHSRAVARERRLLADRVEFHAWLQWLCDEQLAAVQSLARASGMAVGVIHDVAVGVDPGGADAWAMHDQLAAGISVGAPPDSFNQQGQDWAAPPFRPDRLAADDYGAWRQIVSAVLRHAGGIRIDHVMGLFRLYWIPRGCSPRDGTYVEYDAPAMLDVLVDEARRAGAVVVGENLGTVEPRVNATLRDRGILGSAVLWFEHDTSGRPKRPHDYAE